jgi:ring-1,2-phenylacetyl-CoA epoxidase subunit PaaC
MEPPSSLRSLPPEGAPAGQGNPGQPGGASVRTTSIRLRLTPPLVRVLVLADTALIHAQRLAEWSGHAPVLEEDIALSNLALDVLGQARLLLTHAGRLEGQGFDEDTLAFWRDEPQFFNLTLAELPLRKPSAHSPGGDFADTVLRIWLLAAWFKQHWLALQGGPDGELAAIAAKAIKETRYHQQHAADWVVRLGDGTDESARRMRAALQRAWPYTHEMFTGDAAVPREPWLAELQPVLQAARLQQPADTAFVSTGSRGVHSEHLGYILAEMQSLQRRHPGGRW